jgi:hypothetical protein
VEGVVTVRANFANTTVNVDIFQADGHTLTYNAELLRGSIGSNYSQSTGTPLDPSHSSLEGHFYGPNGQETAGAYNWTDPRYSVDGTFGAKLCATGAAVC